MKIKLSDAAKLYHDMGMNVTGISKHLNKTSKSRKAPYHSWEHYLTEKQSEEEFQGILLDRCIGVGIVTGVNDFRTLDINGCSDYNQIRNILGCMNLPKDYEWIVRGGSLNGYQIHFKLKDVPSILGEEKSVYIFEGKEGDKYKQIELIWNQHITMPPSYWDVSKACDFANTHIPISAPRVTKAEDLANMLVDICHLSPAKNKRTPKNKKCQIVRRGIWRFLRTIMPDNND